MNRHGTIFHTNTLPGKFRRSRPWIALHAARTWDVPPKPDHPAFERERMWQTPAGGGRRVEGCPLLSSLIERQTKVYMMENPHEAEQAVLLERIIKNVVYWLSRWRDVTI